MFIRIATEVPAPPIFDAFAPLQVCAGGLGQNFTSKEQSNFPDARFDTLLDQLRQHFHSSLTAGICRIPRVKAVFFDMDATVIAEESIVEIAKAVGVEDQVGAITERAMQGQLDFEQSLRERVALLAGVPRRQLHQVAISLTLNPGIQAFVAFCREIGVPCFLVSGGFVELAAYVQRRVGFQGVRANALGVSGDRLNGEVSGDIVDAQQKARYVEDVCRRLKVSPRDVAVVGDGANDVAMLDLAGVAVGYKPKPVIWPHLHAMNQSGDHRFLSHLLFGRGIVMQRSKVVSGRRQVYG